MADTTSTSPEPGAGTGTGPFAGVTVVEVGQFVVVPVCAMYLAQGGARVIKIEPVAGDPYRSSHPVAPMETRHFLAKNRGKESVVLDLQTAGAREVIDRLVKRADVFLTNMRPEAIDRRGMSYERLSSSNPRLVYGVASGYGHVGPERDLPGFDVIAQARSGLLHALRAEDGGLPLHSEVQAADFAAAMILFAGVASALYERERTGIGQKVEASLLAGALSLQGNSVHHIEAADGWRRQFVESDLPRLREAGATVSEIERRRGELRPDPGIDRATYRVIRTADGAVALAAGGAAGRARLYAALGMEPPDPSMDLELRMNRLDRLFASGTSDHWVTTLRSQGVPVEVVRHVDEMLFDDHVLAEGLVVNVEHPVVGPYRALGPAMRMSRSTLRADVPSPGFAEHTSAVLSELGYSVEQILQLQEAGAVVAAARRPDRGHPSPQATI